jgi:ferredoxin--NADP+ reductase
VPYERGKVLNIDGFVNENLYVVGWAKRGPSGVIGTNKSDASDVMKLLVAGLKTAKNSGAINDLLAEKKFVSQSHWEAINAAEVAAGEQLGKPRRKIINKAEMLEIAIN